MDHTLTPDQKLAGFVTDKYPGGEFIAEHLNDGPWRLVAYREQYSSDPVAMQAFEDIYGRHQVPTWMPGVDGVEIIRVACLPRVAHEVFLDINDSWTILEDVTEQIPAHPQRMTKRDIRALLPILTQGAIDLTEDEWAVFTEHGDLKALAAFVTSWGDLSPQDVEDWICSFIRTQI